MIKRFETILLEEAYTFLKEQDSKVIKKILQNIRRAEINRDPKFFKKIKENIWEFRTLYSGIQYRFLAFWYKGDKGDKTDTFVIATHGFIKKSNKIPMNQIEKAEVLRVNYFKEKKNEDL